MEGKKTRVSRFGWPGCAKCTLDRVSRDLKSFASGMTYSSCRLPARDFETQHFCLQRRWRTFARICAEVRLFGLSEQDGVREACSSDSMPCFSIDQHDVSGPCSATHLTASADRRSSAMSSLDIAVLPKGRSCAAKGDVVRTETTLFVGRACVNRTE